MRSMMLVVWLALCIAVLGLTACSDGGGGSDAGPDGSTDTDTDTDWQGPGSGMCDGVELIQPGIDGGVPVGIERCPFRVLHRYDNPSCAAEPEVQCIYGGEECDIVGGGCPTGQACANDPAWGGCRCITPCMNDDDCGSGEICLCPFEGTGIYEPEYSTNNGVRHCIQAKCRTDADCAPYRCGLEIGYCGGVVGTRCHTDLDECEGPDQCPASGSDPPRCGYDYASDSWVCDSYASCD